MIFDPYELNYSKIRAYLDCPFLYRYIYVERRFTPPTSFSSLGLSVHRALASFHARKGDLGDLLAYYEDAWLHQGYSTPQQSMEFYNKGAKVLEDWWLHYQQNPAQVIYSEKSFEFPFEKWRVKGTIDRVDRMPGGFVEVIDYKMGFEGKTGEDVSGRLQLSIYAIGLSRALKLKVGAMAYFVLTGPSKISVPYDPSGEEAILNLIRETGDKMLALDLSRKGKCERCPIRKLCPESTATELAGPAEK
jgi:putative RecB family exonuclease